MFVRFCVYIWSLRTLLSCDVRKFCEWQVAKLECEQQLQDNSGSGHWFIGCWEMLKETSVILQGLAIEIVGSYSGCSTGRQIQEGKRNRVSEGDIFNPKRYSFKRLNFCSHCVFSFSMLLSGVNSPNCENHIGGRFKTYDNNYIKSNKPRSLTFVTWCFGKAFEIRLVKVINLRSMERSSFQIQSTSSAVRRTEGQKSNNEIQK